MAEGSGQVKPDKFWQPWEQRRKEAVMQFIGLVSPEQAVSFVKGVEEIHKAVKQKKPDNIIISLRGGAAIDHSLRVLEDLDQQEPLHRIFLPIGLSTDIDSSRKGVPPSKQKKLEIIEQLAKHELAHRKKLGKLAFIDEAIDGTSVNFFVDNGYPIFKRLGAKSLVVIIAADSRQDAAQLRLDSLKKPNPEITSQIIRLPLIFSDKRSLVDDIIVDKTTEENIIPHVVHNTEAKRIIEMITLSYRQPGNLKKLLTGKDINNPQVQRLNQYSKDTISDLFEPKPFIGWLNNYSQALEKPAA